MSSLLLLVEVEDEVEILLEELDILGVNEDVIDGTRGFTTLEKGSHNN